MNHTVQLRNRLAIALLLISLGMPAFAKAPYLLNAQLPAGGNVHEFRVSPDNRRVIYIADQDTNGLNELYMVPLTGGEPTKLSHGILDGAPAGVRTFDLVITPDSRRVVYRATNDPDNIHVVPITGSSDPIEIPNSSPVSTNATILISPDSEHIIFDSDNKIFRVPVRGGSRAKISGVNNAGDDHLVQSRFILMSDDGQHIVYEDGPGNAIYSIPSSGGNAVLLSPKINNAQDFRQVAISPDSQSVAYISDKESNGVYELFVTPIAGGNSTRVSIGPSVFTFEFTADSQGIIYSTFAGQPSDQRIYAVNLVDTVTQQVGSNSYVVATKGNQYATGSNSGVFVKSIVENYSRQLAASGIALGFVPNDKRLIHKKSTSSSELAYVTSTTNARSKRIYEGDLGSLQEVIFPTADSSFVILRAVTKKGTSISREREAFFTVALENGNSVQLSGEFDGQNNYGVESAISPRRTHLVYLVNEIGRDRQQLYAAEIEFPADDEFCYSQKVAERQSIYLCL